ncbi:MAG: hypothetical protein LBI57_03990 [Helicobacteraceae bacterium]|jgi:prophage antirepressor-like protein|nr:hypothetical protein [Helicobacteraceae bacterium]
MEIVPFSFEGSRVRTLKDDGAVWFIAKDVAAVLGYLNSRKAVADHCDDPDVTKRYIGVVTGKKADGSEAIQNVKTVFINESGLYALIFGSRLPAAKRFKRWVTSEVLPFIRKTGGYGVDAALNNLTEALRRSYDRLENLTEKALNLAQTLGDKITAPRTRRSFADEEKTRIITMSEAGRSNREIADDLNRPIESVYGFLAAYKRRAVR